MAKQADKTRSRREQRRAFEALVHSCGRRLHATCWRILRSATDAEDVVQDCYLRALRDPDRYKDDDGTCDRLRYLATRLSLNLLRSRRTQDRMEKEHAMRNRESHCIASAAEDVVLREERAQIQEELDELQDLLRVPLVLCFEEGYSQSEVAKLLGVAESTLSERIQKALQTLAQRLRRRGLGREQRSLPALLALPQELPTYAGLEAKLLSLLPKAPLAAAAVASPAFVLPGLLLLGIASLPLWWSGDKAARALETNASSLALEIPSGSRGQAERTPQNSGSERTPVAAASDTSQGENTQARGKGTKAPFPLVEVRGVVRDPGGKGLADALVYANSSVYLGKRPLHSRKARSGRDGSFKIRVPVDRDEGMRYSFFARKGGYVPSHSARFLVKKGSRVPAKSITLTAKTAARPGPFVLNLSIRFEDGKAAEGVIAELLPSKDGELPMPWAGREAYARADASGHCKLEGKTLGDKVLYIDGRYKGGVRRVIRLAVDASGKRAMKILLPRERVLTGIVVDVAGKPVEGFQVSANEPGNAYVSMSGFTKNGGRFRIKGLGKSFVTLHGRSDGSGGMHWSPFHQENVATDSPPLRLVVKRREDSLSRGLHDAEFHGELLDEEGQPLAFSIFDREILPIPADERSPESYRRRFLADALHPRPAQTASFGVPPEAGSEIHETGLERGRYFWFIRKKGFAPAVFGPITLAHDELRRGLRFRLDRGVSLSGRVVSATGAAVEGAAVFLVGEGAEAEKKARDFHARLIEAGGRSGNDWVRLASAQRSGPKGTFRMERIPRGIPLRLAVSRKGSPLTLGPVFRLGTGDKHQLPVLRLR